MGQQQLLLLVLGIVIVGLAVVVGIQAFGENQKKANADALVNDGVRIASDAQAWALKPTAFGGGNGAFTGVAFQDLGYTLGGGTGCTAAQYGNLNGCFTIAITTAATSSTPGEVTITGQSAANDNQVVVVVDGTGPEDITTDIGPIPSTTSN
ncbi:MAG: hypothetical protein AAF845_01085 [Bacteroidota bacterium]